MKTRSKSGISKPNPKLCYEAIMDYTFTEPPSFKVASQYPNWCEAMGVGPSFLPLLMLTLLGSNGCIS